MMKKVAKYIKRHILISLAIGIIFVGLFMPRKVLAQSSDKIELIHSNPRLNGWGNTVWDIISFLRLYGNKTQCESG